ncbi:MAG TPA: substrate-binding domain-containing protein [Nocardioidaceae bacterium]|nr:substrate-binding domain-containing protein [Nocardioidaceae bacterium]
MTVTRGRARSLFTVMAVVVLALAGCSTQREGSGTSADASGKCARSADASAQYEQTWSESAQALGLSDVEAPPLEICEVDTSEYAADPGDDGYQIALAAQGPTNSWALTNEEAFQYAAEQRNVEVLYASANGDATKQVDNIQQLAAQQPDAMVVVPMGPGITGQVRAAAQQGTPVVLCAGRLEGNHGAVTTVTRSYEMQATLWAEWLIQRLDGQGKVAMLSGIPGVPTAEYQKAAAEKVFAKEPGIDVVAKQYTDWSPTKAKTVAASLLAKYPDLDGIWSDSAISDLGVVQAYREAGKPVPPVTGDSSNAFLKAVEGSDVPFALSAFPPEMSTECLDVTLDVLEGKPVPDFVNVEAAAFTDEQLKDYVRPECTDNLWVPSNLPQPLLTELELC